MRIVLVVFIGLSTLVACNKRPNTDAPGASDATTAAVASAATVTGLTAVDQSYVCMVNNQYMGKPQIPVVVEGRTYFGCCAMCKEKLEANAQARRANDPVTGRSVDKADAVIGRNAEGQVFYFESSDSLARYGRS